LILYKGLLYTLKVRESQDKYLKKVHGKCKTLNNELNWDINLKEMELRKLLLAFICLTPKHLLGKSLGNLK